MSIEEIIKTPIHKLTQEQKDFYVAHGMSEYEKQINVPYFNFTDEQLLDYNVYSFNEKQGELQGYNCKCCKNKGEVWHIDNGKIVSAQCKCMKIRKTAQLVKDLALEDDFKRYRLENFNAFEMWQREAVLKILQFPKSNAKFIAFLGESGSGKTHLATALLREYAKQFKSIAYMRWAEDSRTLKANTNESELYKQQMNKYKQAEVLYIDDFLKVGSNAQPSQADLSLAFEIIDYRYKLSYITIISSERLFNEIMRLDMAVAGRIAERTDNGEYILEFKGQNKNYRLKLLKNS